MSFHLYRAGRKPTSYDYDCGLENFFSVGEKRIYDRADRYILEFWDGEKFVPEDIRDENNGVK